MISFRLMQPARYPIKTLFGVGIAAALSLFAVLDFYGEHARRNGAVQDPYQIEIQEKRFEALRGELPPVPVVGFVSDLDDAVSASFLTAQYCLAPTLLADGVKQEWVVGSFYNPVDLGQYAATHNLTLVKDFSNGVALFRSRRQ